MLLFDQQTAFLHTYGRLLFVCNLFWLVLDSVKSVVNALFLQLCSILSSFFMWGGGTIPWATCNYMLVDSATALLHVVLALISALLNKIILFHNCFIIKVIIQICIFLWCPEQYWCVKEGKLIRTVCSNDQKSGLVCHALCFRTTQ
jgi:hypothetical protein